MGVQTWVKEMSTPINIYIIQTVFKLKIPDRKKNLLIGFFLSFYIF